MDAEQSFFELDLTPVLNEQSHLLQIVQFFVKEPGTSFLFSGGNFPLSQKSFLGIFPDQSIEIQAAEQRRCWLGSKEEEILRENPWDALKHFLGDTSENSPTPAWIGYLGYEMGVFSEPSLPLKYTQPELPLAFFQHFALMLTYDHITKQSDLKIERAALAQLNNQQLKQVERLKTLSRWKEILAETRSLSATTPARNIVVSQPLNAAAFKSQVSRAKELIGEGIIYQVNLSQKLSLKGEWDPFAIFKELTSCNPAPYACYLDLPFGQIISSSPEQFLLKKGEHLFTEPIKGTAPRGACPEQDQANRKALLESSKENAELLMITDLMRNDLGKISLPGSVKCTSKWQCHAYQNVFHLSSPVQSLMQPQWHFLEALRTCFPGGSITGCPKFKAMEVIHELEQRARQIYTGSVGYFTSSDDFNFNISIRTLMISGNRIEISLGAGIVADSDPEKEFHELLHKVRSIFKIFDLCKEDVFI